MEIAIFIVVDCSLQLCRFSFLRMGKHGKSKKHNKRGKGELPNPSPNAQQFRGPIISRNMRAEEEVVSIPLIFTGVLSSSAGGVIDTNYNSDPSGYGLSDWTGLAGVYGECRVLGLEVKFFPNNRYSKISVNCTPLVVLVDREAPTATLGTYQLAASHESARIVSLEDPWTEVAKMQNAEESQFLSTSGTQALFSVKMYADGLTVTTQYGRCFVYLLIQFRGRR